MLDCRIHKLPNLATHQAAQQSPFSLYPANRGLRGRPYCNSKINAYSPLLAHTQPSCKQQRQSSVCAHAASPADNTPVGVGEIADVEDVEGIRVVVGEANRPLIEYLVKWKERQDLTWEPVQNLSDNLLRDFEDKWWKLCREGDAEAMKQMLEKSQDVLPHCVDSNERSALHFVAAVGQEKCCAMLCEAGADVDQPDKEGYTPLHMAVGYSHVGAVKTLLDAGASPEISDNQGRNVVQLVDSIRDSMPYTPQLAGKRIALEEVAALLAGNLFEEVLPKKILDCRTAANGSKEYLLQWLDGSEDSWVKDSDMSKEVIEDYEASLEYASADCLVKMKKRGDQRLYLVKWLDGTANSWEFEDHISPALIQAFESGEQDTFAKIDMPEALQQERPLSKRAARRAKKAARRAALGDNGSNGSSSNGSHSSDPAINESNGSQQEGIVELQEEDSKGPELNSKAEEGALKLQEREVVSV